MQCWRQSGAAACAAAPQAAEPQAAGPLTWLLAVGGGDGSIRFWRLHESLGAEKPHGSATACAAAALGPQQTLAAVLTLPASTRHATSPVRAFSIAPCRQWLSVGCGNGTVWVAANPCAPPTGARPPQRADVQTSDGQAVPGGPTHALHCGAALRVACGHRGSVQSCATHPTAADVYATTDGSYAVRLWHAGAAEPLGPALLTSAPAVAVAFSNPRGHHVAAGLRNSVVEVYSRHRERVAAARVEASAVAAPVSVLAYSPDGAVLACACHMVVVLLGVESGGDGGVVLRQRAVCRAHSAAVTSLDFSTGGAVLRSCCNAYGVRTLALSVATLPACAHGIGAAQTGDICRA